MIGAGCLAVPALAAAACGRESQTGSGSAGTTPQTPAGASPTASPARPERKALVRDAVGAYASSKMQDSALVLAFDGLSGIVSSGEGYDSNDHVKVDVMLPKIGRAMNMTADDATHAGESMIAMRHYASLVLPRGRIRGGNLEPVAVHGLNAFYPLDGKRLSIVPRAGIEPDSTPMAPGLTMNRKRLPDDQTCPNAEKPEDWNNFEWTLSFTRDLFPRTLKKDWRKDTARLNGLVELRHGRIEDALLEPDGIGGTPSVRRYKMPRTKKDRGLKEIVRVLIERTAFVHFEIRPLDQPGAVPSRIVLDCSTRWVEATITQLPVPGPDLNPSNEGMLQDLLVFQSFVEPPTETSRERFGVAHLPTPEGRSCVEFATSDCGCCPPAGFVEPDWNGEV